MTRNYIDCPPALSFDRRTISHLAGKYRHTVLWWGGIVFPLHLSTGPCRRETAALFPRMRSGDGTRQAGSKAPGRDRQMGVESGPVIDGTRT